MELLRARWAEGKSVCVGLDSDLGRLPKLGPGKGNPDETSRLAFNKAIVDATADLVCAYKPNTAFYEAQGASGIETLAATSAYIRERAPGVPIILDAKRADIGSTNEGYATFAFELLGADAITVHPYLGKEALKPFLERADKGVIVLARTSNPGSGELQDLELAGGEKLSLSVARRVANGWNDHGNCCLVAGGTYPGELAEIRARVGDLPILVPGVGAQGGDAAAVVRAGRDSKGQGLIINSSRGIIFASSGSDFAEAARRETQALDREIKAAVGER